MGVGWFLFGFAVWAWIAFLCFAPSDNPKSLRSQVQNMIKDDFMWKFNIHFTLWVLGPLMILLLLWEMSGP